MLLFERSLMSQESCISRRKHDVSKYINTLFTANYNFFSFSLGCKFQRSRWIGKVWSRLWLAFSLYIDFLQKTKKILAFFTKKQKKAKKKIRTYISTNNATNSLFMNIIEYTLNRNYNQLFIGKAFICKISFFKAEIIN